MTLRNIVVSSETKAIWKYQKTEGIREFWFSVEECKNQVLRNEEEKNGNNNDNHGSHDNAGDCPV